MTITLLFIKNVNKQPIEHLTFYNKINKFLVSLRCVKVESQREDFPRALFAQSLHERALLKNTKINRICLTELYRMSVQHWVSNQNKHLRGCSTSSCG